MSMHIIICIIKYGWARGSEFWINSISIRWEKMHPFYVTALCYISTCLGTLCGKLIQCSLLHKYCQMWGVLIFQLWHILSNQKSWWVLKHEKQQQNFSRLANKIKIILHISLFPRFSRKEAKILILG